MPRRQARAVSTQPEPSPALGLRVEPSGPSAERAVAGLCAGSPLTRDADAPPGSPAATGDCADGDAAIALIVRAAAHALDDTDLQITLSRR